MDKDFRESLGAMIRNNGVERLYGKGDLIIREGDIERNVYLVKSGLLRVFLLSEVEDQTIRFGYQGSIINSLASFIKGTPSEFYIEALRKTSILTLPKEALLKFVFDSDFTMRGYIQLLELSITQQIEREIDLLTPSPAERLKRVLQRSPNLFQEVPLKYIASYLRMTPETLSRIRSS